jgi:hypothetical protein
MEQMHRSPKRIALNVMAAISKAEAVENQAVTVATEKFGKLIKEE